MSGIREGFPALVAHEGEWAGEYIHVDPQNAVIDRHESRLQCRFPDEGSAWMYSPAHSPSWATSAGKPSRIPDMETSCDASNDLEWYRPIPFDARR